MTAEYFDRDGEPISQSGWVKHSRNRQYREVKTDALGNLRVCTFWAGVGFAFNRDGAPLIFETTLFANGIILGRDYIRLYATEQEALIGHDEVLDTARSLFLHAAGEGT